MDPFTGNIQKSPLIVNLGQQKVCLDIEETLGQGAFGTVTRAVDNRGISFAIKNVFCHDMQTYQSVAQEVDILLSLTHPNIVVMYGFDFVNSTAVLIMEFCGQGTLNKRLDQPVDIMVQLQWMEQLGSALTYLHGNNIVHRDLKTENVLLSENNVKIADFGIARHFVSCRRGRIDNNHNNYIPEYLDAYMGTFAGTPYWIAPEVFDKHYTEKADIFSLGVIFYAICERQYCNFQGERYYGAFTKYRGVDTGIGLAMYEQQQHIEPIFHKTQSKSLKTFICSMLYFDPDDRLSVIDVCDNINEIFFGVLQIDDSDEKQPNNNGKKKRNVRQRGCGQGKKNESKGASGSKENHSPATGKEKKVEQANGGMSSKETESSGASRNKPRRRRKKRKH